MADTKAIAKAIANEAKAIAAEVDEAKEREGLQLLTPDVLVAAERLSRAMSRDARDRKNYGDLSADILSFAIPHIAKAIAPLGKDGVAALSSAGVFDDKAIATAMRKGKADAIRGLRALVVARRVDEGLPLPTFTPDARVARAGRYTSGGQRTVTEREYRPGQMARLDENGKRLALIPIEGTDEPRTIGTPLTVVQADAILAARSPRYGYAWSRPDIMGRKASSTTDASRPDCTKGAAPSAEATYFRTLTRVALAVALRRAVGSNVLEALEATYTPEQRATNSDKRTGRRRGDRTKARKVDLSAASLDLGLERSGSTLRRRLRKNVGNAYRLADGIENALTLPYRPIGCRPLAVLRARQTLTVGHAADSPDMLAVLDALDLPTERSIREGLAAHAKWQTSYHQNVEQLWRDASPLLAALEGAGTDQRADAIGRPRVLLTNDEYGKAQLPSYTPDGTRWNVARENAITVYGPRGPQYLIGTGTITDEIESCDTD